MKISDRHIWRREKFTPDQKRLEHRRETLRRFLEMDAPDIIVWHSARLLIDGMDAYNGGKKWRTSTMRQKIRAWWKYTVRAKATFAALDLEEAKISDEDAQPPVKYEQTVLVRAEDLEGTVGVHDVIEKDILREWRGLA